MAAELKGGDIVITYDSAGNAAAGDRLYEFVSRQALVQRLSSDPFDADEPHLSNCDYVISRPYNWAEETSADPGASLVMPNGAGAIGTGCTVGAYSGTASSVIGTPTDDLIMASNTRSDYLFPWPSSVLGGAYGNAGFRRVRIQGKFEFPTGTASGKGILAIGYNYSPCGGYGDTGRLFDPAGRSYDKSENYYAGARGNIIEVRSNGQITRFAWDGTSDTGTANYNNIASETITAPTAGDTYYFQLELQYELDGPTSPAWRNVVSASTFKLGTNAWADIDDNTTVPNIFPSTIDYSASGEQATLVGAGTWAIGGRNEDDPWDSASYKGVKIDEIRVLVADQTNDDPANPTFAETDTTIWKDTFDRDGYKFASRRPDSGSDSNGVCLKNTFWAAGGTRGTALAYQGDFPKGGRGATINSSWTDGGGGKTTATDSLAVMQNGVGPVGTLTLPRFGLWSGYGKRLQVPSLDIDQTTETLTAGSVKWDTDETDPTLRWRDLFLIKTGNIKRLRSVSETGASSNVLTAIGDAMEASIGFRFRYNNKKGPELGNPIVADQTGVGLMVRVGNSSTKYSIQDEPSVAEYTAYFGYVFAGDNPPCVTIQKVGGVNEYIERPDWIIGRWNAGVEYILAAGNGNMFPPKQLKGEYYQLSFAVDGDNNLQLRMTADPKMGYTILGTVEDDASVFDGSVIAASANNQLTGIVSYMSPLVSNRGASKAIDCSLLLEWFDLNHAKIDTPGNYWKPPTEGFGFTEPPKTAIQRSGGSEDVGDAPYAPAQMETVKLDYAKNLFLSSDGTEKRSPAYSQYFGGANVPRQYMSVTWLVLDSELETLLSFLKGCRDNGKAFGLQNSDATASSPSAYYAFMNNMGEIPFERGTGAVFKVGPVKLIQSFGASS